MLGIDVFRYLPQYYLGEEDWRIGGGRKTTAVSVLRMDTDSAYIALAAESIDGLVRADRRAHYFRHRSQWLAAECRDEHEDGYVCARITGRPWTATESCCSACKVFDKRTPGLFKVEWPGDGSVGLCSKT